MYIKELAATFGRLEKDTLPLSPGLNVIQAPNEGGKSTWTAFLRVMLYGLNTRDRSPTADKRRYMPWSGSSMEGRMDVSTAGGDLTIIRRTQRVNSPMGAFSAVYTGTATPSEEITAANCGEALLGVPQEIYERSAYIRQSGMVLDQNAALERRIAALIATGEEDTSYTDAADRLRKQLNRRQSNRVTGLLPQLDQEILQLRDRRDELTQLEDSIADDEDQIQSLLDRQAHLQRQLSQHDAADLAQQAAHVRELYTAFVKAQNQAAAMTQLTGQLPGKEDLESIRGSAAALDTLRDSLSAAEAEADTAQRRSDLAHARLSDHPLADHTPEEASRMPVDPEPRPTASFLSLCLPVIAGAAAMGAVMYFAQNWLAAIGAGLGLMGLLLLTASLPLRRRQAQWDARQTQLEEKRQNELSSYTVLYNEAAAAKEAAKAASAAKDGLRSSYQTNLAQLLSRVRVFHPAEDLPTVKAAVEDALRRRSALDQTLREAETARLRWDMVENKSLADHPPEAAERPTASRQQLQAALADCQMRLTQLRQQIHTAQGRIQAVGDGPQLQAELELKLQKRETLQAEYDAIELASQVLAQANTTLQNRFSPALGEKSAEIFTKLTRGRYNKVLLDREMVPSAQERGQLLPHEAAFLSQGTADQLYLAVRLAICQMVLPEGQAAPILLDDALVTFDDERMAAALDYLVELAGKRQILLFTCQNRELQYLTQAHPGQYQAIHL